MNKILKWNFLQAFLKALTSAQKLHCRTIIFEEHLPMTASALKYDHDISIESLKLFWYEEVVGKWIEMKICYYYIIYRKIFPSFPMHWKKFSILFLFNFVPHQILNFLLMFHFSDFAKLNFVKKSLVSKSIYSGRDCFIFFDVIIR